MNGKEIYLEYQVTCPRWCENVGLVTVFFTVSYRLENRGTRRLAILKQLTKKCDSQLGGFQSGLPFKSFKNSQKERKSWFSYGDVTGVYRIKQTEKCHLVIWYSSWNKKQFPTCLFLVPTWISSHKMTCLGLCFILYFFKLSSGCGFYRGVWPWSFIPRYELPSVADS